MISVYADGSSTGKAEGPCGWGWVVTDWEDILTAGCEGSPNGSNNTAELMAAVCGLRAVIDRGLHVGTRVELVSDSTYCLNLANGTYKPQVHVDIVKRLQALVAETGATTRWVKGHAGDPLNEKADQLAKRGRDLYCAPETRKRRRSRKREERRRKRALVKAYKERMRWLFR
jgi:ribonuclease HI